VDSRRRCDLAVTGPVSAPSTRTTRTRIWPAPKTLTPSRDTTKDHDFKGTPTHPLTSERGADVTHLGRLCHAVIVAVPAVLPLSRFRLGRPLLLA
jgi:hypothetical protein